MQALMRRDGRMHGERGAVMIQAAVAMVVLLGFASFVSDYGVLWLSRDQAQVAADAGAMAGAVALAYDGGSGDAVASATAFVRSNPVWFAAAGSEVFAEPCPAPNSLGTECVRVKVYRDGTTGSTALPTIFGPVLGITSQGVQAMATAQVAVGNSTPCLKPLAIPDRWVENRPPGGEFQKYQETGPGSGTLLTPADIYVPPSDSDEGTGLTVAANLGELVTLTFAYPSDPPGTPITPGMLLPLTLSGPNSYDQNIAGCNGRLNVVGAEIPTDSTATPTATTVDLQALLDSDPGAVWNTAERRIESSCAPSETCGSISPRLVALAVFDVDQYQLMRSTGTWCSGGIQCVKVVNMVGFFIDTVTSSGATGYVTKYPGQISPGPFVVSDSSFLPAVTLVR